MTPWRWLNRLVTAWALVLGVPASIYYHDWGWLTANLLVVEIGLGAFHEVQ